MSVRDDAATAARLGLVAAKVREAAKAGRLPHQRLARASASLAELAGKDARRCRCGCAHSPDYGACDKYEAGANGRCVYCDHGDGCHPGRGPYMNTPLHGPRRRGTRVQHAATFCRHRPEGYGPKKRCRKCGIEMEGGNGQRDH